MALTYLSGAAVLRGRLRKVTCAAPDAVDGHERSADDIGTGRWPRRPPRPLRLFDASRLSRSTADYWWWIPVAGPMVGGVVAAVLYYLLIELHHPRDEPEKPREEEEDEEDEDEDSSLKDKYEMITMS